MTPAELAHLALALVPGVGRARFTALTGALGTPEDVLHASPDALGAVHGVSRAAARAIANADVVAAARIVERVEELGGAVLLDTDPKFPALLRLIPAAPLVLFALGDLTLLNDPAVAIVGSRTHTRYGAEACRHFAGGVARAGLVVVSGMARGLDAVAHTACLDAGRGTIGILGNGLGVVYPAANRRLYDRVAHEGCLLTEFRPGERPNAGSFPRRNRLISGLARCTLVIEAGDKSGTLITVNKALEQGREVLVVPGPITSPLSMGCNRLLQQGAKPVLGLRDVLEEYGRAPDVAGVVTSPSDLTDEERRMLDALDVGADSLDELAIRLNATAADVLAVLTSLEIRGLVTQESGGMVRRAVAR